MIGEAAAPSATAAAGAPEKARAPFIRKVAVLGAGAMGSRIAAHIANAGVPVVLLDIVPADAAKGSHAERSVLAIKAIEAMKKSKPAAFYDATVAKLVVPGNLEDDLALVGDCDWIVEAVAESLEIKRSLIRRIDAVRRPEAIVTTNTSGLPIAQIAEEMPESFRRNWFGTHFFNPPRYMRLLEMIPTPETDPAALSAIEDFGYKRLGKTVVRANDSPNFIANRIGTFALMNAIRVMQDMDLSIEQVDALTGSVLGWPKTGTFRLADMVGLDVLGHVAANFLARVKDERPDVRPAEFMGQMLERKWLGDKTGQGFYRKTRGEDGKEVRLGLDWKTLEYRPSERASFPSLEMLKNVDSVRERVKTALEGDPRKDVAAAFYWRVLPELWNYAAHRIGEVSDNVAAIDAAMKTGFNWELGPFEMWDAAGVQRTVERMRAAGMPVAPAVEALLASGATTWYRDDTCFDLSTGAYVPVATPPGELSLQTLKRSNDVVRKNPGASLVDLGDGVGCIEFHTKMNALGGDIVTFVTQTLSPASDALYDFDAFVISGDTPHFSVGANLMQLLLAIQEQEWDDVDFMIRAFQKMTQTIKFCPRPVVTAPFGMTLGGGCEISLHSAARQPHAELYMGLVEAGVGLVPGGGGCKEMTLRAIDQSASIHHAGVAYSVELIESMKQIFETVAMAKVSTSAAEARKLGFLTKSDRVTMNRARLIADAKIKARELADEGYNAPPPRTEIPAPGENILATLRLGVHTMLEGGYISEHDAKVARWIAYVLCGGAITPGTHVTEQYLLDLEREAFLSLCGERKTQERIAYTLKRGKPLRN